MGPAAAPAGPAGARPIEEAPAWVRDRLSSPEQVAQWRELVRRYLAGDPATGIRRWEELEARWTAAERVVEAGLEADVGRGEDRRVWLGAFAVLFDSAGRVLLCHRRDVDVWDLPGGGVERDESPWAAVVREVAEETGLQAAVQRLTGAYHKPAVPELVLVFRCQLTGGELRPTDEADRHIWAPVTKLPANMNPNQAERVRDALAVDEVGPALRVQHRFSVLGPLQGR